MKALKRTTIVFMSLFSLLIINSCDGPNKGDIDNVSGTINVKQAKLLNDTYTRTRYDALTKILGHEDNRSTWWSIEDIRDYLAFAEKKAKEDGYKLTGIRIYQGAYPAEYKQEDDSGGKKAGFSTVFWVPTGKKAVGSHQEGGLLPLSLMVMGQNDLEIPPLNNGHQGNPPSSTY